MGDSCSGKMGNVGGTGVWFGSYKLLSRHGGNGSSTRSARLRREERRGVRAPIQAVSGGMQEIGIELLGLFPFFDFSKSRFVEIVPSSLALYCTLVKLELDRPTQRSST